MPVPTPIIKPANRAFSADESVLLSGILARGGVIAGPAESCYGLIADAGSGVAIARIASLKGSREARSYVVAAADRNQIESLGIKAPEWLLERLFRIWPAPATFVLELGGRSAADASGSGTIAVRIPADEVLRNLCAIAGSPLVTTSANREGETPARSCSEILRIWPGELDAIVDDGARDGGVVSTIVDLTQPEPVVKRFGAWNADQKTLKELFTPPAEKSAESR